MKRLFHLQIKSPFKIFLAHLVIALFLGSFLFVLLYGYFHLYFTHVNWIYKAGGDVLQHQLGWEWFRQEHWQFPLGKITAYGYPFGTSVTFMDSIPIMAIPFKLISSWFKPNHQYFGVWELSAVVGQVLAGLLIFHEFTHKYWEKIVGAALLVLSPPMVFRAFYHSSLSAHWILLLAIWFIILEMRQKLWRGAWICLFAIAVLINVYFIPMLLPLCLIGWYFRFKRDKVGLKRILTPLVDSMAVILVVLLAGYSIGLFSLSYQSISVKGYGEFSWNLNGFINPFHYSSNFMKGRITGVDTQYEGFSYLGLGNLIILPVSVYLYAVKNDFRRRLALLLPFGIAAIVYTLFALSNRAFFDAQPLWDFQISDRVLRVLNLFRSSGRFIWPVFYFLVLFGALVIIRNTRFPVAILLAAVVLQFIDIQPLYQPKQLTGIVSYQSPLQSDFWKEVELTNKHIVILPAKRLRPPFEPFALFAVRNQLTLNVGYFARYDEQAFTQYSQAAWDGLKEHHVDAQSIYILSTPEYIEYARENLKKNMFICDVDSFTVIFSTENKLALATPGLSDYCSIPAP